jgi:DNA-binding transcriptional ArsR family regulator
MTATTFDVLAEPRRRDILDLLRVRERSVGELVEGVSLSQPGVSKHLRVLRDAGLVEVLVDAQLRWYRVRAEPLAEIDAWLAPYRRFWTRRLDALERHLEDEPGTDPIQNDETTTRRSSDGCELDPRDDPRRRHRR